MSAKAFTVSHGGIRLRVRLLPTIKEVHRTYQQKPGRRARAGRQVHAFFQESLRGKNLGTVYLPEDGRLAELVPHEVSHAAILYHGGVLPKDDEAYCTTVGILCSRIQRRLELLGVTA